MNVLHSHGQLARRALLGSVMLACGAGCASRFTVDHSAAAVPSSGLPPAALASPDVDADLIYDPDGPADDIVGYPSVVYGGVTIYFVEGRWYRYGREGWGYLRSEPAELARLREMHQREPRGARRAEPEAAGVAERQGPESTTPPGEIAPPARTAVPAKKKTAGKKAAPARTGSTKEPLEGEER